MATAEFQQAEAPLLRQYVGPRDPELIRKLTEHTQRRYSELRKQREPHWQLWREISEWIDPTDGRFLWNYNKPEDKARKSHGRILNGWARMALGVAANGMQSGLTPRSRPWWEMESENPDARTDRTAQEWVAYVTQVMRSLLEGSNFYDQTRTNYPRVFLYGQGPLSIYRDPLDVVRFESHEIGSYYLGVDGKGRYNTMYTECVYTVGQMVDRYEWGALSQAVQDSANEGSYDKEVKVIRAYEPNRTPFYDPGDVGWRKARFRQVDIEEGSNSTDRVLSVEPRDAFHVAVPHTVRELHTAYASTSPGRESLGDVKTLQVDELTRSEAKEQIPRPTRIAGTNLKGKADRPRPDETIYADILQGQAPMQRAFDIHPGVFEPMSGDILQVQHRLDRHFFRDVFQAISMIERGNVRELEIDARVREQMGQIGPVVESIIPSQNDVVLRSVFQFAEARGLIPPAPPSIAGAPLRVNYVSILAQGQRAAEMDRLDRWLNSALAIAQGFPGGVHRFDADAWMQEKAAAIGVPPTTVATDEQVMAGIAAQAQMVEQHENAALAESQAKAAKDANEAGILEDSEV